MRKSDTIRAGAFSGLLSRPAQAAHAQSVNGRRPKVLGRANSSAHYVFAANVVGVIRNKRGETGAD